MTLRLNPRRMLAAAAALCALAPAVALAEVGALAYSPSTDHYVVLSLNLMTLRAVQQQALDNCTEDDCRILRVFDAGECVALAVSDAHYGHGKARSQEEADARALDACGQACRVIAERCAQ